jgi:hypothetical protein
MSNWTAIELPSPAPLEAGSGRFTAVANLTADGTGVQQGTGFLIHPALLVTAAHVVTYVVDGRMWIAGRIGVNVGQARIGAWRVAVPIEYIASLGRNAQWDIAVLRLPEPIAGPASILSVAKPAGDGSEMDGSLWGNPAGLPRCLSVHMRCEPQKLSYAVGDLPAWSGGPATRVATAPEGAVALGVHRFWNAVDRRGEAVPIDPGLLREAIETIRQLDSP